MAGVSCVLTEDQFLCPVCLEVFTDPVTTPCGHNFCQTCLKKHWDNTDHYHCPLCNENFNSRPQLKVNTIMSEMASQFKNRDENKLSSSSSESDVLCDMCAEPKLKALKSCLVCLLSYCQNHLQPHSSIQHLKKHQLIDPLKNLGDRICGQHDIPLELFCRRDWKLICLQCIYTDHKNHNAVPLKEQFEEERAEIERRINKRRELIKKVQRLVEVNEKNADAEMEKGVTFFDGFMKCVQESLSNFRNSINEKRKNKEEEAAALIVDLKSEILYLEKRRAEMEELSKDQLRFLQTFTSDEPTLDIAEWVEFGVPSYQGRAAKAVCEMEKQLNPKIKKFFEDDLNQAKEHAFDLTLDPDTAHPQLVLSKDLKEVHHNNLSKNFSDNPERFSFYLYVFGKQKFSTGKFYFEVQVKGKTGWALGVAKESVERKGKIARTPKNGFWLFSKGRLESCLRSSPEMVGVFVDYEEGLVCLYDADSTSLIHSYTDCCFNGNIIPLFNHCVCKDGYNSAPLILTPVTD